MDKLKNVNIGIVEKKNIEEDEKYYKGWFRLREFNWDRLWIVYKERS